MAKSNRITVEKLKAEVARSDLKNCPELNKIIEFHRLFDQIRMEDNARYMATTDIMIEIKKIEQIDDRY